VASSGAEEACYRISEPVAIPAGQAQGFLDSPLNGCSELYTADNLEPDRAVIGQLGLAIIVSLDRFAKCHKSLVATRCNKLLVVTDITTLEVTRGHKIQQVTRDHEMQ
jgi:hypothetical protein